MLDPSFLFLERDRGNDSWSFLFLERDRSNGTPGLKIPLITGARWGSHCTFSIIVESVIPHLLLDSKSAGSEPPSTTQTEPERNRGRSPCPFPTFQYISNTSNARRRKSYEG